MDWKLTHTHPPPPFLLGEVKVPSHQKVKKLCGTYKKMQFKGELIGLTVCEIFNNRYIDRQIIFHRESKL